MSSIKILLIVHQRKNNAQKYDEIEQDTRKGSATSNGCFS